MALRARKTRELIKHILIWSVLTFEFFPLYVMFVISTKTNEQYDRNPFFPDAFRNWHAAVNWEKAWTLVSQYLANSIVVAVASVAFCLVMSLLTSYVLARYRFPGKNVVYYGIIATMFLPGTAATLVTTITVLESVGLGNSLWALIVLGAVGGQVVCIFILRQFIEEIPKELFESAQIDGAGHFAQIRHIILPMSGSILGTLAILQFVGNWNNLVLPLVVLRDQYKFTVPVGLMHMEGEYVKQWGEMMAGYAISSIPLIILFIFTMRLFVRGIAAGAIKG